MMSAVMWTPLHRRKSQRDHEGLRGIDEGQGSLFGAGHGLRTSKSLWAEPSPLSRVQHPPSSHQLTLLDSAPSSSGQDSRPLHGLRILESLSNWDEASWLCPTPVTVRGEAKARTGEGTSSWWQVCVGPRFAATEQTLILQPRILSGSLLPRQGPCPPAAPGRWARVSFSAWEVSLNDPSLQGCRASTLPGAEQVASENVSYHPS